MAEKPQELTTFTVASSGEDLRFAARTGNLEDAKEILKRYKGDSNELAKFLPAVLAASDSLSGNKALHLCAANGHVDVLRLLIAHGADVNATNISGSTPLHYASLTGQLNVVKELIQNNAMAVVENKYEKTALDEARSAKKDTVADFLVSHVEETNEVPDLDLEKGSDEKLDEQVKAVSLVDKEN